MKRFTTIYLFELKKIYGKKMVWTAAAVMLALQLASSVVGLFMKNAFVDADGNITYRTGYEEDMVVREAAQAIYGMSGFDLPLQLYLWMSSFPISLSGAILISFFVSLAAAILGSVFIMLLSELFRNGIAALSVMLGATLFTMFVPVPVRCGLASQLYNFMPMQFFNDTAFMDKRLFCIFGKYFTGLQAAPVFYLAAAVILAGIGYKVYKEYQVRGR